MLVVLTEMYCNKVSIQITQGDEFIQKTILDLSCQNANSNEVRDWRSVKV